MMYYDYDGTIRQDIIESKMKELAQKIGYEYHDISWLKRAFYTEIKFDTNEEKYANSPLATLGDRVLSLIIVENLFDEMRHLFAIQGVHCQCWSYQSKELPYEEVSLLNSNFAPQ